MEKIGRTLGFEGKAYWNSFNYLGIPIFKGKKRSINYQELVDKIKNKIAAWGTRWLNIVGKLVF